eukprot:gene4767-6687_t
MKLKYTDNANNGKVSFHNKNNKLSTATRNISLWLVFVLAGLFYLGICASIATMLSMENKLKEKGNENHITVRKLLNISNGDENHLSVTKLSNMKSLSNRHDSLSEIILQQKLKLKSKTYYPHLKLNNNTNSSHDLDTFKVYQQLYAYVQSSANHTIGEFFSNSSIAKERSIFNISLYQNTWQWYNSLHLKLICTSHFHRSSFYFYHTRKAAGSSIKQIINDTARLYHVPWYESEGKVLNEGFLRRNNYLTVTTLRHPIDRIFSLYWYEHVSWFAINRKTPEKVSSMIDWIEAWLDSGSWKKSILEKNIDSVYIEIENYYVKMLSNWNVHKGSVTEKDFEIAKTNLEKFDLIFLHEMMNNTLQIGALHALFPILKKINITHSLKANDSIRHIYSNLTLHEDELIVLLNNHNSFDMRLWSYAQKLVEFRLHFIQPMMKDIAVQLTNHTKLWKQQCMQIYLTPKSKMMTNTIGIYRPFGHKGPFK